MAGLLAELQPLVSAHRPDPLGEVLTRHQAPMAGPVFQVGSASSDGIPGYPDELPAGVTPSEWSALHKSRIDTESEHGSVNVWLVDLDGDTRRDLVVEQYIGGTGLWTYGQVYRREGERFVSVPAGPSGQPSEPLYGISGRGGEQEARWIELHGTIYLAFRDGRIGEDRLDLRLPFEGHTTNAQSLFVRYRYRHELPPNQPGFVLDPAHPESTGPRLHQALQRALNDIAQKPPAEFGGVFGRCPEPPTSEQRDEPKSRNVDAGSIDADDETTPSSWPWFGPAHYTSTIVADFPIWFGARCAAGRLLDSRSSYKTDAAFISLGFWYLPSPDATDTQFEVRTTRRSLDVRIGPTPAEP